MTLDERIEAAARAIEPGWWGPVETCDPNPSWNWPSRHPLDNYPGQHEAYRLRSKERAVAILRAAFPELFPTGEHPSHWIAPWEATDEMDKIAGDRLWNEMAVHIPDESVKTLFAFARDSYLSHKEPKE